MAPAYINTQPHKVVYVREETDESEIVYVSKF